MTKSGTPKQRPQVIANDLVRRANAVGCMTLLLFATACSDAMLDLTDHRSGERNAAGSGGSAGVANAAGSAGQDGVGGSIANAFYAPGFCDGGFGECLYDGGELNCTGEVGLAALNATSGDSARLVLDMTTAAELRVLFEICDPVGYALNIGDSPSDNGGGGDWGDFEHDAEVLVYGGDLTAWSSDLGYEQISPDEGYHPLLLSRADYLPAQGCSVKTLVLRDQYIADSSDPSLRTQSPTALRINPSTDAQGSPDAQWYIGVNRVVSNWYRDRDRVGSGVNALRICFTTPPPEEPPRAGP
jgi:hypothetical protein